MRLLLKNFSIWCKTSGHAFPADVVEDISLLEAWFAHPESSPPAAIVNGLVMKIEVTLLPLIKLFCEEGSQISPTFKLWKEYLQRVSVPFKMFLAASRNGNWQVYQSSKAEFLPLLFASNRSIYAKYMPVILLMMKRLPAEIVDHFEIEKQFVTKLSHGRFNMVWPDYALETTENKSLKGNGGIIGLTLKGPALARWFLARPITAQYSERFQTHFCKVQRSLPDCDAPHNASNAAMRRWDNDIHKMTQMFGETYLDPFSLQNPPAQLVNFATGVVATSDVQTSLVGALEKGDALADKFITERLVLPADQVAPHTSFYDTMPRSGVKTMGEMAKPIKIGKRNVRMSAEVMYLRLLAINAEKQVPLERVMAYENSPVPLSMFTEDGQMHSGTKAEFMHKLEELLPDERITTVANSEALIIDGHAVVQILPAQNSDNICFKNMAIAFMEYVLCLGKHVTQIHVVFDRYLENSIKANTREKRAAGKQGNLVHVLPETNIPRNWKLFLTRNENKTTLAKFYTEFLMQNASERLTDTQSIIISGGLGEVAVVIRKSTVMKDLTALHSNHEEADTRLILHAAYAADHGARTIIVSSPDTDVLVMLIHHRPSIRANNIFFRTGHDGKHTCLRRYVPVHSLYDKLTHEQLHIMLGVYCITGCDTVSAFYGHGKRRAFNLMLKHPQKFQSIGRLGTTCHVSESERVDCTRFIGNMYGKDVQPMNDLRCEKAKNNITGKKLPPTDDSFMLHILRSCYQLMIWRQACIAMQSLPIPTEYGYRIGEDNKLYPKFMNQTVSAQELLNNLVCNCEDYCSTKCTCSQHGQACTNACICEALPPSANESELWCANQITIDVGLHVETIDSDDDDDNM